MLYMGLQPQKKPKSKEVLPLKSKKAIEFPVDRTV